jgi:hypothetical protein
MFPFPPFKLVTGLAKAAQTMVCQFNIDQLAYNARTVTVTPAATVALDLSLGSWFIATFTANTTAVFSNPTNPPTVSGQNLQITIINTSGGALTGVTWGTLFKNPAAPHFPATSFNCTYAYAFDGTFWRAVDTPSVDISN